MRTIRTALFLTAVVLLAGCSKLTESNLEKIQTGMTTDQVKDILGDPTSTDTGSLLGVSGTTYTYHTDKGDVKIGFVNGKVFSTEGSFQ